MDKLNGYKTYMVAAVIGIVAALQAADVLDASAAEKVYGLLGALGLATLRQGVAKAAPVLLLALSLSSQPAIAQDVAAPPEEAPMIGCGAGTCSLYVLDVSWPPAIGVNAIEFVRFRFGVGLAGGYELGQISPLGGVCLIPRVGPTLGPVCPGGGS